jgi:endonuclease V-like protein UPF0215 family
MRIVGVDDGAFQSNKKVKQHALLVSVAFHKLRVSGVRVGRIEVDGRDANKVLMSLLRSLRYDVVMLSGVSFGGFNVVDIATLSKKLHKPVIAITGDRPHNEAVRKALREHFVDWRDRWRMIRSAGKIYSYAPLRKEPRLYFEVKGATALFAKKAIGSTAVISRLPEPIRVAGILARGLSSLP